MIIAYIFLGLITLFVLEVLNSLRDFDLADAHIVQFVNISNPLPIVQTTTITGSIRKRFSEFYEDQEVPMDGSILDNEDILHPNVKSFYRKYMKTHIGKLTKTFPFSFSDSTIKLMTVNPEWNRYNTYSNLAYYTLKDESLFHVNSRHNVAKAWKHCFYQYIDGTIEAAAYDKNNDKFAAGFYNPENKGRFIVYYNDLECNDDENVHISEFYEMYCGNYTSNLCTDNMTNIKEDDYDHLRWSVYPRNLFNDLLDVEMEIEEHPSYDYIPLEDESNILNIAVTKDIVVYTTLDAKMKIKCLFRDKTGYWDLKELEYPPMFKKYRVHQNLGLGFIINSYKGEEQLLIVDMIGTEEKVQLVYLLYKFSYGKSILGDDELMDAYKINNTEEIVLDKLYGSSMYNLKKITITEEIPSIDVINSLSLPKSIIKTQPGTNQTIVVSLHKYALQVRVEDELDVFTTYLIAVPDDYSYKIKNFDISDDGAYIVFLTYNKNKIKVFIYHNTIHPVGGEHEMLYLVNFNYPLNFEEITIKEVQFVRNEDNELLLMLILESGEIAIFSLQFGTMSFERLSNTFLGDDLEIFSIISLIGVIFIFCLIKIANNTRLRIHLRPPR